MCGLSRKLFVKRVIRMDSLAISGEQLQIQADDKQGCFIEILWRVKQQLDAMLSHHSRVMVVRVDLHAAGYTANNYLLSNFIRKMRKKLKRQYDLTRIGFIWVREQEKSKSQHYHFALLIDANKVRYPNKIIKTMEEIWQGWEQPKPYTPKNCYYLIHRGSLDDYQEVFYRLSYMAKERGKGYKGKTANDYSASRIKAI